MNWNEIKNDVSFNDIKEMEYKDRNPTLAVFDSVTFSSNRFDKPSGYEILCQSWYMGYKVLIVNYFTHPCAYIGLRSNHKYDHVYYEDIHDIDCHGGLTYSGDDHIVVKELQNSGWFIGWDYAHSGDWYGPYPIPGDKKWSTMEIINECMSVVNQLSESQAEHLRLLELEEESK